MYSINPFELVGIEGLWGLALYAILLPIMTFTPCDENKLKEACVVGKDLDFNTTLHFESPAGYFS